MRPERLVPPEVVFAEAELDAAYRQVLAVPVPAGVRRRLEFFASQFDFCDLAAEDLEYKSKDTIRLAGKTVSAVCAADCGRDKIKSICSQTENGLSVRALMTILHFAKAIAWFRGQPEVSLADLRQILPWCLHEKLQPNITSPFFDQPAAAIFRIDRIAWIRKAFDLACEEYLRLNLERDDPVAEIEARFEKGLDGVGEAAVMKALNAIESLLGRLAKGTKLYAHVHADVVKLKYFHQRYSNYLQWLKWRG